MRRGHCPQVTDQRLHLLNFPCSKRVAVLDRINARRHKQGSLSPGRGHGAEARHGRFASKHGQIVPGESEEKDVTSLHTTAPQNCVTAQNEVTIGASPEIAPKLQARGFATEFLEQNRTVNLSAEQQTCLKFQRG